MSCGNWLIKKITRKYAVYENHRCKALVMRKELDEKYGLMDYFIKVIEGVAGED